MLAALASVLLGLLFVHTLEGKSNGALVVSVTNLVGTLLGSFVDVTRLLINAVIAIPLFVLNRPIFVSRLAGIVGLAYVCHTYQADLLELMDAFFRDVVNPAVHFLYTMTFMIRVVYEPVAAFFNYYISVTKTAGKYVIAQ